MRSASDHRACVTAIAFVLTLVCTATAKYGGGTGTADDPYQIATAADLIALGETLEDYDKHFILTADIDLDPNLPGGRVFDKAVIAPDTAPPSDNEAPPSITPFTGVFDGNGHMIKNLKVRGAKYLGLFGRLDSTARISNLCLETVEVSGTMLVGGLVGDNHGRITTSCSGGSVGGTMSVGGLVGNNHGRIAMSYSSGSVRGTGSVGGLVGYNGGSGKISSSYSSKSVNGKDAVGGLVGSDDWNTVNSSFWDTQTSGQATSDGGTGKTTTEMQTAGTYLKAGWDFVGETANGAEDIWWISEGRDYPRLWWQADDE